MKILLVDNEEVITFGFKKALSEPGVEIDCAQSLDEARRLIADTLYDAAIVDLRLSNSMEMEGLSVVMALKHDQKNCRVIMLTAYGEDEVREAAAKAGVDLFLEKPIDPLKIGTILSSMTAV